MLSSICMEHGTGNGPTAVSCPRHFPGSNALTLAANGPLRERPANGEQLFTSEKAPACRVAAFCLS